MAEIAGTCCMHCLQCALLAMQSEQTMAEQEAALGQLRDQLTEVRASHAQLEQALAASTAESQATIEALRSSMACASSEALELAQRRCAAQLREPASLTLFCPPAGLVDTFKTLNALKPGEGVVVLKSEAVAGVPDLTTLVSSWAVVELRLHGPCVHE